MSDLDDDQPPAVPSPDGRGGGGGAVDGLAAELDGAADAEQLRLLSRSPHPYHRQNFELLHPSDTVVARVARGGSTSSSSPRGIARTSAPAAGSSSNKQHAGGRQSPSPSRSPSHSASTGASSTAGGRRNSPSPGPRPPPAVPSPSSSSRSLLQPPFAGAKLESSAPTSDSGTDADDEHFLKGLPAPKTRLHKGLRGRNEPLSGTSTPLLSPALLEEEGRRMSPSSLPMLADDDGAFKSLEASLRDRRAVTERTRRKKEIIRRATELLIVSSLGAILYSNRDVKPFIHSWSRELTVQALAAAALVTLYPIRVVLWAYKQQGDDRPSRRLPLRVPASFDPAPILYPPTMALYVALLLAPTNRLVILPNLVLSLACLPKPLIPFAETLELCSPVHWLVSILPLMVSAMKSPSWGQGRLEAVAIRETAVLLYPLHQNLCMLLHRLTTTSILPAELQLLSVALINILLLSTSPQMVILKAVLWGGGMGILVFCGQVIRWGVTLARVPKWRFRRALPPSKRTSFFRALCHVLPLRRRSRHDSFFGSCAEHSQSDSDSVATDDGTSHHHGPACSNGHQHHHHHRRGSASGGGGDRGGRLSLDSLRSPTLLGASTFTDGAAVEPPATSPPQQDVPEIHFDLPSPMTGADPSPIAAAGRRHTLPSTGGAGVRSSKTHTPSGRRRRSASSSIRAFFSLTQAQARARKWLYAAWVYACIVAIVLGGVRDYIGRFALGGEEPIGWALGYLFGGIPWFRLQVVQANLERWVCLPARHDASDAAPPSVVLGVHPSVGTDAASAASVLASCDYHGWVEYLRRSTFGAANSRLVLSAYWLGIIVVGMAVVFRLTPVYEVDTRRKVFHFMMVGMLLPATFVDPTYVALALALVLALFLVLDLIRASQLPPLSKPIASFLTPYVDGRDLRGPVVVSHIFLLIGCSIPLWLSLAALTRVAADTGGALAGWEVPTRDASMVSGVVCVGLGDAAASLIGRRWGHRKWVWGGGKSLEGSFAFAVAVFLGLAAAGFWLRVGGWSISGEGLRPECCLDAAGGGFWRCAWSWLPDWHSWTRSARGAAVCASMASLTEAVLTGGNDNVVVPVVLWTCVKSLGV